MTELYECATYVDFMTARYLLIVAEPMKTLPAEDAWSEAAKNLYRVIVENVLRAKSKIMRKCQVCKIYGTNSSLTIISHDEEIALIVD